MKTFLGFTIALVTAWLGLVTENVAWAYDPVAIITAALEDSGMSPEDFSTQLPQVYLETHGVELCNELNANFLENTLNSNDFSSFWETAKAKFEQEGVDGVEAIWEYLCQSSPQPPACP